MAAVWGDDLMDLRPNWAAIQATAAPSSCAGVADSKFLSRASSVWQRGHSARCAFDFLSGRGTFSAKRSRSFTERQSPVVDMAARHASRLLKLSAIVLPLNRAMCAGLPSSYCFLQFPFCAHQISFSAADVFQFQHPGHYVQRKLFGNMECK